MEERRKWKRMRKVPSASSASWWSSWDVVSFIFLRAFFLGSEEEGVWCCCC